MEPLCKIESPVMFGADADRYRGADQVYEFGGPGDKYTLVAPSDKIAVCALIFMGGGTNCMVFFYPLTALQPPVAFDPAPEVVLDSLFGEGDHTFDGLGRFMALHYDDVLSALDTVLIGDRLSRASVMETIGGLGLDPILTEDYLVKYTDKKRTSAYDMRDIAKKTRALLASNKEANVARHKNWLDSLNKSA